MVAYDKDILLLEQLHAGEPEAFAYIYNKYRNPLRYLAESMIHDDMEAQDIVQDFFVAFWERQLFNHIDPTLDRGDGNLIKNYLYRCIHNKCLNYLTRNKIRINTTPLDQTFCEALTPEFSYMPDKLLENKELGNQINAAIAKMGPQSARIFALTYGQSKRRSEIAAELNISQRTVANLLLRTIKRLRASLKNIQPPCGTTSPENVY